MPVTSKPVLERGRSLCEAIAFSASSCVSILTEGSGRYKSPREGSRSKAEPASLARLKYLPQLNRVDDLVRGQRIGDHHQPGARLAPLPTL